MMNLLHLLASFLPGALFCAYSFCCIPVLLPSQPSDTIVSNPSAVTLRHIWKVTGAFEENRVGLACGGLGRLGDDSVSSFAVYFGDVGDWKIYKGGLLAPDTVADWVQRIPTPVPQYPIVGDFFGDGGQVVCFGQSRFWDTTNKYWLYFFGVHDGMVAESPMFILDGLRTMDPPVLIYPTDVVAANLDRERGDELVLSIGVHTRENNRSQVGEIWIYRGGAAFQVDQPTLIIRDQQENLLESSYYLHTADFDSDGYLDMALGAGYAPDKLKFWFGREGSPWNWTDEPDRIVPLTGTGLNRRLTLADLDGDGVKDLAGTVYPGGTAEPGIYLYLSGSGKDFRSRSFTYGDADKVLRINTSMYRVLGHQVGYLNDSSRRYEMLAVVYPGFDRFDDSEMLLLSGGKYGPNETFDGRYRPEQDGVTPGQVFRHVRPLPDCNGDGWDDLLISNDDWFGFEHGIALVLAGGPEIPNDDPTVSVREAAVAGESGGLYLWPNPVGEELHIAWRGNLRRMPVRFTVHDMSGRRVAGGEVDPSVGAAQWRCGEVAAGVYVLTAYDEAGEAIASTRVVKE